MTDFCKRLFCSLIVAGTFILSPIVSYAGPGTPFDQIVFFGDSLSDNGNLYRKDGGFLPKSPPYYKGRFSNREVWSEYTAKYYYDKGNIKSTNYAFGGETAVARNPFDDHLPYFLDGTYYSYWFHTVLSNRGKTLLIIWIGSNDYLNGSENNKESTKDKIVRGRTPDAEDVQELTNQVVAKIKDNIQSLIGLGVKNFLVINLPDFSKTPYGAIINPKDQDLQANLKALSFAHNQKLAQAVAELQNSNKAENIQLFDVATVFDGLLSTPKGFSGSHQINITNTTDACWPGGYLNSSGLRNNRFIENGATDINKVDANQVAQDYMAYLNANRQLNAAKGINQNKIDVQDYANFIANSPALSEAYKTQKAAASGLKPCENPENYVFWDHVHPTTAIHQALAQEMIKFIDANFKTVS